MKKKKLIIKVDGTTKIDLDKIDIAAQSRMFSGGADSYSIDPSFTREDFEMALGKIARPLKSQDDEEKS